MSGIAKPLPCFVLSHLWMSEGHGHPLPNLHPIFFEHGVFKTSKKLGSVYVICIYIAGCCSFLGTGHYVPKKEIYILRPYVHEPVDRALGEPLLEIHHSHFETKRSVHK